MLLRRPAWRSYDLGCGCGSTRRGEALGTLPSAKSAQEVNDEEYQ
jgi:hypothetical protein